MLKHCVAATAQDLRVTSEAHEVFGPSSTRSCPPQFKAHHWGIYLTYPACGSTIVAGRGRAWPQVSN